MIRALLHLAALQASRRDRAFAALRARLEAAGERPEQAMIRDGRDHAGAAVG